MASRSRRQTGEEKREEEDSFADEPSIARVRPEGIHGSHSCRLLLQMCLWYSELLSPELCPFEPLASVTPLGTH